MEIFGFKDMPHRRYAENLGIFLQLVNITRDFKEDMELNRQYFPTEDFKRLRLNPLNITSGDPKWKAFVEFQLGRAWTFLKKSRSALNLRQRRRLQTAETIAGVYLRLFEKLKRSPGLILEEKIALSKVEKLWAVVATLFRLKWGRG
jgi:phytoene synthase